LRAIPVAYAYRLAYEGSKREKRRESERDRERDRERVRESRKVEGRNGRAYKLTGV